MQQGRVVVVTGAGGGIGSRIVDRFPANGDGLIGLDWAETSTHRRNSGPSKRDEQPQDLAGPVFLLCSRDADYISGQTLVVDGGKITH